MFVKKKRSRRFNRSRSRFGSRRESDDDSLLARVVQKIGYAFTDGNEDEFQTPDFDLQEIEDGYNTDAYIRQAIDKYNELMFKSDWDIVAKDEQVHEYLDKRIAILSDAMGIPFDQFLRNISDDLVKFSNVFIVKAREELDEVASGTGINVQGLGNNSPVAAYFRLPPQTMEILVDEHGTIEKYRQVIDGGDEIEFDPEDVIHITYKKPAGRFFGVPMILPALEDVKLLREVEDNVAKLIWRHLYPLFIYKVGIDKPGYEASDEEIEELKEEIRDMPTEGGLVLPERHDVDVLGADQEALDAEAYLKYYERRAFTGLGVTETLMGRGATSNRSTAETQSSELRDKVRAFQKAMQDSINYHIIRELLMEGGYDPLLNPEHKAKFKFREIDMDLKIKEENHAIYKFEHNATTHEEMREELGMDPVSEEDRLYSFMFDDTKDTNDTDNREEPENQHNQDEFINKKLGFSELSNKIGTQYLELKNEILDLFKCYYKEGINKNELKATIENMVNHKKTQLSTYIESYNNSSFYKGLDNGKNEIFKNNSKNIEKNSCKSCILHIKSETDNELLEFFNRLNQKIDKLIENKIKQEEKSDFISMYLATFSVSEYKIYKVVKNLLMLSYNYGFAKAGKESGISTVSYIKEDKTHNIKLDQDNLIEKMPVVSNTNYYLTYKNS